jgi:acetylornithine deacetylase/succinyl-diaminopimelate desuccinylase-like protein
MIDPVALAQALVRIDTTNPPGNEGPAVAVLRDVLEVADVPCEVYAADPDRPNLVARLGGRGDAPPLLLQGHLDVVPTTGQQWTRDPFGGDIVDGWLWGRGTLDMKGGLAMFTDAVVRWATGDEPPPGDVILCALADEEASGRFGAQFLVEQHPEIFDGVRHCIGEFGGFSFRLDDTVFYPIQVAERVSVRIHLTVRGPGGHGSLPLRGGATAKLGRVLTALDRKRTPVHVTPASRSMLEAMVEHASGPTALALRALLDERTAGPMLRLLRGRLGVMESLLRNTVCVTVVRGGDKHNVIPAKSTVTLDGRMLPGLDPADMVDEVRALVGGDVEITYETDAAPSPPEPDMALFPLLADIVREQDPNGVPIPYMSPAVTDGRWFSALGIQPYGFMPMDLPPEFDFGATVHGADERVPVDALRTGADAIDQLIRRYEG